MPTKTVRRYGIAHVLGALIVITGVTGFFGYNAWRGRNADIGAAKAWDIKGPPCPQLTEADWSAKHLKAPKVFDYDGTKLGRWAGDASCSDIKTHGGAGLGVDKVCQFTAPAALTVTTGGGVTYYVPSPGQPATVRIHDDTPSCVMAGKFTAATE
ncbi:MAG: hypothetical protein ACXWKM_09635 [Phenylobacterium sp.]